MADKEKVNLDWKNIFKLALTLFLITAIASLCLAVTNYVTADTIAERNEQSNIQARQQVLAEADRFEEVHDVQAIAQQAGADASIVTEAYQGFNGNETVGYTIKTTPNGYGGAIEVLTGIDMEGKITGVTILSQSETAGLGAKATEPAFKDQYTGKDSSEDLTVIKNGEASGNQIVAITGATITSDAVTDGVNVSCKIFETLSQGGK